MIFLSLIGVAAILLFIMFVIVIIANAICRPMEGNDAISRMGNRASREMEQNIYSMLSGLALAVVCVIGYAFYCLFVR